MRYFPAFFDVADRRIAIVGGGETAARKARLFAKAGARLRLVAPAFDPPLREEFADAEFVARAFAPEDLDGAVLVVAASEDEATDTAVAEAARAARVPVNVVDRPELCDFTTPSIVDRGDVVVGISTGGAAPVLGRRIRQRIEAMLPARLGDLVAFAAGFRETVTAKLSAPARRAFWERVFDGPVAAAHLAGDEQGAREAMLALLNRDDHAGEGVVHIVGAGPGDPELMTLKALRVLQDADVVLHDKLVSDDILDYARRDAERVFVGKSKANHAMAQEEIGALMIRLAGEGKRVVRLKGGDPFLFGRGGEELDQLRDAGVLVEVVPGVTGAAGCGAAAGLPLTHRDFAQAVTFVTGHAKGDADPDLDWAALAKLKNTLVVYMGVTKAGRIADRLIAAGRAAETPVAVIENGTRPDQVIAKGTLGGLEGTIVRARIAGPAILVIGEVAAKASGAGLVDLAREQAPEQAREQERLCA